MIIGKGVCRNQETDKHIDEMPNTQVKTKISIGKKLIIKLNGPTAGVGNMRLLA